MDEVQVNTGAAAETAQTAAHGETDGKIEVAETGETAAKTAEAVEQETHRLLARIKATILEWSDDLHDELHEKFEKLEKLLGIGG